MSFEFEGQVIEEVDHNVFCEAKQMRKRAEEDAKLLANRIALLKAEEAKAVKKLEETRQQASKILESKAKIQEAQQKKEEERKAKEEEERIRALEKRNQKNLEKQLKDFKTMSLKSRVQNEVKVLKLKKQENLENIECQKQEEKAYKMSIKQKVIERKREAEEKKRRKEEEKREAQRVELAKKIDEENDIRRFKEDEIKQMEHEELELIQKLQNTQQMQRNAYDELECALTGR